MLTSNKATKTKNKATKTNNTKKRLTFAENQQASQECKSGKQWQRTNKRDQIWEEV